MAEARASSGKGRRWLRRLALAGLGCAGVVGAGNAWILYQTSGQIVAKVADAPVRPVAIVLGNRIFPDGSPAIDLYGRLVVALELYQAGKVRKIFVSGAAHPEVGYDEPAGMAAWLEKRGVPKANLILDRGGHRTAATMADAAAAGLRQALVCTQAYHLPRSLYLANHAGINATGVVAVTRVRDNIELLKSYWREALARTETVLEVAWRGVKAN
jgi:vancomycin permeability regulator SanA